MPLTTQQREDLLKYTAEFETRRAYKFRRYFPDCQPDCVPGSMRNEDHVDHVVCGGCKHRVLAHHPGAGACLSCPCKAFVPNQRYCRGLYPKHTGFMSAGAQHRERLFLAANRIGKTDVGAYELTTHMTGVYPDYWTGRRFFGPIRAWAAGDTMLSTRDVLQVAMLGPIDTLDSQDWSGMLPKNLVHHTTRKTGGVSKCIDQIWVRHVSGKTSSLEFKCHPAGTRVLMADGVWAPIETIQLNDVVRSPDGTARKVTQCHAYVEAPVVKIATRSTVLNATPNHPCHTQRGWVNAGDLVPGDVLSEAFFETDRAVAQEEWRVALTALMIGDGCMRGKTPSFTCAEPAIVEMIRDLLPVGDLHLVRIGDTITYTISGNPNKNILKNSLVKDGLWGHKAHKKYIPDWVFTLPRRQRVIFLRWLWTCDGSVTNRAASYATVSTRLAHDVSLLLLSVGVRARVAYHTVSNQSRKKFQAFYIALHGTNRHKFSEIGKLNRDNTCVMKPKPKGPTTEVTSVTDAGKSDVYCVGVDGVHELIVEGFRVGNSYDQGRRTFQGTEVEICWLDEECPEDVYAECLTRTMTTNGLIVATLTPLQGLTPFIQQYLQTAVMLDANGDTMPAYHVFYPGDPA